MLVYRLTRVSPLGHRPRPVRLPAAASPGSRGPRRHGTMAAMRAIPDDLSDRLIESVPNVSEGRRLDVVDRLADGGRRRCPASTSSTGRATPATTAPSSPSPARPAPSPTRSSGSSRPPSATSTWTSTAGEHPRIGAVDVIPFVPLGDTTMDDCVALARRFGARVAERFDLPVYLYARAARAARPGEARRRPARPVRGPQGRDRPSTAASRTSGRPGCTRPPARWPSAPGRSSSPATSTSTPTTSSSPSGSRAASANRAAGCRRSRRNGFWSSSELGDRGARSR